MELNLERILNIFKRKIFTYKKRILMLAGISFLILTTSYLFKYFQSFYGDSGDHVYLSTTYDLIALIIFAGIFPFMELVKKQNAAFELTLPASRMEKFVVDFISVFIIIPIYILIIDIAALYFGSLVYKIYMIKYNLNITLPKFPVIFNDFYNIKYTSIISVIFFISISFLGAIFFKKLRAAKTWLSVGLILIFIFIISAFFIYFYKKATGYYFPYLISYIPQFDSTKDIYVIKRVVYHNGKWLDYVPWFLTNTFQNILSTLITLAILFWSWIRYKKRRV